jgi:hypothetical protein
MPFNETSEGKTQYCTHTDDNSICSVCLGNNMNNTEDWEKEFDEKFSKITHVHRGKCVITDATGIQFQLHRENGVVTEAGGLECIKDFIRTLLQEQSNKIISRGQEDWVERFPLNTMHGESLNQFVDFIRTIAQQEYQRGREEIIGLFDKQLYEAQNPHN